MRYGTYAMEVLINEFLKPAPGATSLEAKVFGGGDVLRGFTQSMWASGMPSLS